MSGALKKTTGLTGLAVAKYGHRDLGRLYTKIIGVLETMPNESSYRQHTEKLIREKNDILQQNKAVAVVEEKINCGQIEELILQAKNELQLAQDMATWKPWEPLIEEAPQHQWTWPPHK